MSDPTRLEFTANAFCDSDCECRLIPDPIECKNGRFIFWDDYARLKAENERLRADVERLCKAGDAMAHWVGEDTHFWWGQPETAVEAWNAAKEGKPSV